MNERHFIIALLLTIKLQSTIDNIIINIAQSLSYIIAVRHCNRLLLMNEIILSFCIFLVINNYIHSRMIIILFVYV